MNQMFYHPEPIIDPKPGPQEDVYFITIDGERLNGWLFKAIGDEFGTVIHFHGNYANISYSREWIDWMPEIGFNVFTFDYRGYGKSSGVPSREGLYKDSVAAIKYILSRRDIDTENMFIFAQSLGGANAIAAVAKNRFSGIRAVAIEGGFSSYRSQALDTMTQVVQDKIGNVPCLSLQLWPVSYLLVTNELSPLDLIDQISPIPVLVIHDLADDKVPFNHGQKIYERADEPKFLWTVSEGGHLKTFSGGSSSDEYRKKLREFFIHFRKTN